MSLAFVKLGGDQSRTEVSRSQAAVMISVALASLGGTKVIQKSGRSQAAVMISIVITRFSQTCGDQNQAKVRRSRAAGYT